MIQNFTPIEVLPKEELTIRHARCRELLERLCPEAGGLLIFLRINIYYLSGSFGNGVLWLPKEGQPVLALRKSAERARLESPLANITEYRSYSELPGIFEDFGSPLSPVLAVEQNGVSWSMGLNLTKRFKNYDLRSGDTVMERLRSVKSPWEINKIRLAGARHHLALHHQLSARLKNGLSEARIAHIILGLYLELGHCGITRMQAPGEEMFFGGTAIGDNANYPNHFNGPVGVKGVHPAAPFMGYTGTTLKPGDLMLVDNVFCLEGYQTDKTQLYFNGAPAALPDPARRAQGCALEIQTRIAEQLRPGAIPEDLYLQSLNIAKTHGFEQGYMGFGKNQVPFLGHGIGLCTDEWPVIAKRFSTPLEENMTIALEPKIGLPGLGMAGVENTFLVTPQGGQSLTGEDFDVVYLD